MAKLDAGATPALCRCAKICWIESRNAESPAKPAKPAKPGSALPAVSERGALDIRQEVFKDGGAQAQRLDGDTFINAVDALDGAPFGINS